MRDKQQQRVCVFFPFSSRTVHPTHIKIGGGVATDPKKCSIEFEIAPISGFQVTVYDTFFVYSTLPAPSRYQTHDNR